MASEFLSLPLLTVYAELHDLTAFDRPGGRLDGGFAVKVISGHRYWYHQRWIGGKRVQRNLGLETPELLQIIREGKRHAAEWRTERGRRRQLVRSLKAALNVTTDALSGRVIERLSDYGIFAADAALIGTHAFMTYGAMLGAKLERSSLRTGDIDVASVNVATGAGPVSFVDAVQAADAAFFVVPARPGSRLSTALKVKGGEIRVELLTPLAKGRPWEPAVIERLGFSAQKTPFLDYLIEAPIEATYLFGAGVRVRIPRPGRFALHKLIVAANRNASAHAKAVKDVAQAEQLIEVLDGGDATSGELAEAGRALKRLGKSYLAKALAGAERLGDDARARVRRRLT